MAEIKSTLDLIMERTRNLSMTPEEKEALRRKEWHSRIQGWLQRYLDGLMGTNSLKEAILDLLDRPEKRSAPFASPFSATKQDCACSRKAITNGCLN
jgi:hypothetical protein